MSNQIVYRAKILFAVLFAVALSAVVPARSAAESAGIIGGADGPTSIIVASGSNPMEIIETQLPWLRFRDASTDETEKVASMLDGIADSYLFVGRAADDGTFSYYMGFLTAQESPLTGLTSRYTSAPGREDICELMAEEADEPTFAFSGIDLYYDMDAPDVIVAVPAQFEGQGFSGLCGRIARGDYAYLGDATARGVYVCAPPAPYLAVSLRDEWPWRTEYIRLTEEEVMTSFASSYIVVPEQMGDFAIVLTTEDGADLSEARNAGISGYLYDIAAQKCGFYIAAPGEIGTIVRASMTVTGLGEVRTQEIDDPATLAELAEMLRGAEWTDSSGCPFTGVLTLAMEDGSTMTIRKATDSCGAMIFGSAACYRIGAEENARFWEIFSDAYKVMDLGD